MAEPNECYIGKFVSKKHIENAKRYLDPEETMIGIFFGNKSRPFWLPLREYLILTNKRIIIWKEDFYKSNIEIIDYDEKNILEQQQGLLFGNITFNINWKKERFGNMSKIEVPIAIKIISEKIAEKKKI